MPEPIHPEEVRTGEDYEQVRAAERRSVVETQRERRVHLGARLTLVFESRDSIRVSLEEMLRSERVSDAAEVSSRVDAFNELVPHGGNLGATLYVEASDPAELDGALADLAGVERCVYLEIAGERVAGAALESEPAEELAAASYVVFTLTPADREAWRRGAPVTAGVAHPQCSDRADLSDTQQAAIGVEL